MLGRVYVNTTGRSPRLAQLTACCAEATGQPFVLSAQFAFGKNRRNDRPMASASLQLINYLDAHGASGADDLELRAFHVDGVEVGHLGLRDGLNLSHGDLANDFLTNL